MHTKEINLDLNNFVEEWCYFIIYYLLIQYTKNPGDQLKCIKDIQIS